MITFSEEELIKIIKEHLERKVGKNIELNNPNFQRYEDYEGYVELWENIRFQAEVEFD